MLAIGIGIGIFIGWVVGLVVDVVIIQNAGSLLKKIYPDETSKEDEG